MPLVLHHSLPTASAVERKGMKVEAGLKLNLTRLTYFSIYPTGISNHLAYPRVQPVHGHPELPHRQGAPLQLGGLLQQLAVRAPGPLRGREVDGDRQGHLVVLHFEGRGDAGKSISIISPY